MAARLALTVVLIAVAFVVAWWLRRRLQPQAPTQPWAAAPTQLDRHDFASPATPWLVAVFTSATCHTCEDMVRKARALASPQVAVDDVEYGARRDAHRRYGIDAVPITVVADAEGVVRAAFVGPATATDLWAAVAEARQPGSSPEPDLGRA